MSEVVRVEHHVAYVCTQSRVDAVVLASLDLGALADAARREEQLMYGTVHELVYLVGDFLALPVESILAVVASHAVGILQSRLPVPYVARSAHHKHFARLAVGHHSSITVSHIKRHVIAAALNDGLLLAPGASVVGTAFSHYVNHASANIGAARTEVGESEDAAVLGFCQCWNAVAGRHCVALEQYGLCRSVGCEQCCRNDGRHHTKFSFHSFEVLFLI